MKNYKIYVFFLFLFFLINISHVYSKNFSLLGKVFVIDPGHGGADPGAIYFKTKESDLNLSISIQLKEELERRGAIVYLTRSGDYDLSNLYTTRRKKSDFDNRIKLINSIKPDLVISIHMNAEDTGNWFGMQLFYHSESSKVVAESITETLKLKRKTKKINNIYFLENLKHKAILIEYGFISNYTNLKQLKDYDYITKNNKLIVDGIEEIFNK